MYEFINRFSASDDEDIVRSLEPILGGPGWRDRLDRSLSRGPAVAKLFRETLKAIGDFKYVVSTKIDKATAERPHFFITYATKSSEGMKTFRRIEYDALKEQVRYRATAKARKREEVSHIVDMFPAQETEVADPSIYQIVTEEKSAASDYLLDSLLREPEQRFDQVVTKILEAFVLRETDVKDICVMLAKSGQIANTWGGGNRKPKDRDAIRLAPRSDV